MKASKAVTMLLSLPYVFNGMEREQLSKLASASPIFIPRKHTKMSYRAQQRAAQKRKK
jgi:hypothetical protein